MTAFVLVASTEQVLASTPAEALGEAAERRQRSLRRSADREDFLAARMLTRTALALADEPSLGLHELRQRCDTCNGLDHGRPEVTPSGYHVSWSHSNGMVAAGVSHSRLGIDIEAHATHSDELTTSVLTPDESRIVAASADPAKTFLLAWTGKEALVKAGLATLDDVRRLPVLQSPLDLVPSAGGLRLSSQSGRQHVAAAATAESACWHTIDANGHAIGLPGQP